LLELLRLKGSDVIYIYVVWGKQEERIEFWWVNNLEEDNFKN